jgi:hypothetical protein
VAALSVSKNLVDLGEVAQEAVLKDEQISPELRERLKARFRVCAHWKAVLDGTHNVVSLVGDGRVFPVPEGFSTRIYKKLKKAPLGFARQRWQGSSPKSIGNVAIIHLHPKLPLALFVSPPNIDIPIPAMDCRTARLRPQCQFVPTVIVRDPVLQADLNDNHSKLHVELLEESL